MEYSQIFPVGFYAWWLFMNGCLYFAEFHFIQNFTGIREKKHMVPYVLMSDLITFFVMYYQCHGVFRLILYMGLIFCFSKFLLKMKWTDTVAPAMIILTLFTFL